MKRPAFALILLTMICIALTACAKEPSYMQGFKESEDFDPSLLHKSSSSGNMLVTKAYLEHAPLNKWNENAVKVATKTNTVRIYFMSAAGITTGPSWGDCTLIVFPNGETMLVDTGYRGFGEHLERNLFKLGIEKIDHLVITHNHDDHAFGMVDCQEMLDNFHVGTMYWNGIANLTPGEWQDKGALENICKAHNIPLKALAKGDTIQIGEALVTVLFPTSDMHGHDDYSAAMNKYSLVFRLDFGNTSALFTGDAEPANVTSVMKVLSEEGRLDILDTDIVKMPHHGIAENNPQDFVNATTPKLAFAMGHHPVDQGTYGRYCRVGTKVYMESLDGYVRFVMDGNEVTASVSKERQVKTYEALDRIAQSVRSQSN